MKKNLIFAWLASVLLAGSTVYAATELKNDTDKLSYTIGNNMGTNFKKQEIQLNTEVFMQGLKDGLSSAQPVLTEEQQKEVIKKFQDDMMKKMKAKYEAEAKVNKDASDKFLAENAKKKGVSSTKSGLQYEVIEAGKGAKPAATDTVSVDYEGKTIDGKVFDSSYKRGKPVSFPVNGVVKGWTEALQMMPVGSTWILYLPADLGYGQQGVPGSIGPNQALIFKIHLISIEKKHKTKPVSGHKKAENKAALKTEETK